MALGPKWGKNGPKMAKKWDLGSFFYVSAIFGPFFPHFGPRAIFFFLANFFPFLDFRPFSILCQAAWLANFEEVSPAHPKWPCLAKHTRCIESKEKTKGSAYAIVVVKHLGVKWWKHFLSPTLWRGRPLIGQTKVMFVPKTSDTTAPSLHTTP